MLCLMHSSVVFSRHHVNLSILPTIVPKKVLHKKNKKKAYTAPSFWKKKIADSSSLQQWWWCCHSLTWGMSTLTPQRTSRWVLRLSKHKPCWNVKTTNCGHKTRHKTELFVWPLARGANRGQAIPSTWTKANLGWIPRTTSQEFAQDDWRQVPPGRIVGSSPTKTWNWTDIKCLFCHTIYHKTRCDLPINFPLFPNNRKE